MSLHRGARQAGGRCRSYLDAALGMMIDNGNHLVLSGNRAALDIWTRIGAADRLAGPAMARVRLRRSARRRALDAAPNEGRLPWWILRYAPARAGHAAARLSAARAAAVAPSGQAHRRGRSPAAARCTSGCCGRFLLAALNTDRREASAGLAGALMRETLARGGSACRPLIARDGSARPSSIRRWLSCSATAATSASATGCARSTSTSDKPSALDFGSEMPIALGAERCASSWRCRPGRPPTLVPGSDRAERIPRHRQRPFPHRAAAQAARDRCSA